MAFFKLVGAWPCEVRAGLEDRLILGRLPRPLYSLHGEGFKVQAFWFGGSSGLRVGYRWPFCRKMQSFKFNSAWDCSPARAARIEVYWAPAKKSCRGMHVRSGPAKRFAQILEGWASSAT